MNKVGYFSFRSLKPWNEMLVLLQNLLKLWRVEFQIFSVISGLRKKYKQSSFKIRDECGLDLNAHDYSLVSELTRDEVLQACSVSSRVIWERETLVICNLSRTIDAHLPTFALERSPFARSESHETSVYIRIHGH